MPPYHGLWNWGNSITRAPSKVLPKGLQSRLPGEEPPGQSNFIPTLILSLNHTYIVTSLLGKSYLPNWIWSCWRVSRALHVLRNKLSDPAQSNKIRSCSIIICTDEPTLSILEQMSLQVLPCWSIFGGGLSKATWGGGRGEEWFTSIHFPGLALKKANQVQF